MFRPKEAFAIWYAIGTGVVAGRGQANPEVSEASTESINYHGVGLWHDFSSPGTFYPKVGVPVCLSTMRVPQPGQCVHQ